MSILTRAEDTINGPRANDYGDAKENFERIAVRWSQHVGVTITAQQVALMLIDLKLARLCHSPGHEDSVLDIAGYAGCWERVKEV